MLRVLANLEAPQEDVQGKLPEIGELFANLGCLQHEPGDLDAVAWVEEPASRRAVVWPPRLPHHLHEDPPLSVVVRPDSVAGGAQVSQETFPRSEKIVALENQFNTSAPIYNAFAHVYNALRPFYSLIIGGTKWP